MNINLLAEIVTYDPTRVLGHIYLNHFKQLGWVKAFFSPKFPLRGG